MKAQYELSVQRFAPKSKNWELQVTGTGNLNLLPYVIYSNEINKTKQSFILDVNLPTLSENHHQATAIVAFLLYDWEKYEEENTKIRTIDEKKRINLYRVLNSQVLINTDYVKIVIRPLSIVHRIGSLPGIQTGGGPKGLVYNQNWKYSYIESIKAHLTKYKHSLIPKEMKNPKPIIFYTIDPFEKYPILTCMLLGRDEDYKETTNARFWKHQLEICKKIYSFHPQKWNYKIGWVTMFCLKTNLVDIYELEPTTRHNIYEPSWYTRKYDCDEALMSYISYKLFLACDVSSDQELTQIQDFAKENYVGFIDFSQVTMPKFSGGSDDSKSETQIIYHWINPYIPKKEFESRVLSNRNDDEGDLEVLLTDPTQLLYPIPQSNVKLHRLFTNDRAIQSFGTESDFYKLSICLYGTSYLKSSRKYGFVCTTKKKTYGSTFSDFMLLDKKVTFDPLPALSEKMIRFSGECAEMRVPAPVMKINTSGEHVKSFQSNEDLDKKLRTVRYMFQKNGIHPINDEHELMTYENGYRLSILSLHEIFHRENCKGTREEIFKNKKVIRAYEEVEQSYRNYFYFLYIKIQGE
jgi:hypothetical protein